MLVILSAAHHFLDCWPQQDRVFLKISSVGRLGHSTGYPRIVRSSTPAHRTEVDNLPRSPEPPGDSAVAISVSLLLPRNRLQFSPTASRYLLSPTRSRYLRQNGNDPKFFVIVRSNDFAVWSLANLSAVCLLARGLCGRTSLMHVMHHISWRSVRHLPAVPMVNSLSKNLCPSPSHAVYYPPSACRAKCLDCKVFAFLHFSLIVVLHQQHRLVAMDLVKIDRMSAEILNHLD